MNIILQQVLTQIVGFLLLLWLLKKYAWGPLLAMLDDRRNKIATELTEIKTTKEDLSQLRADYEARMQEIEKQARVKVQEAVLEGGQLAREITTAARAEADQILVKAKENIDREVAAARIQMRNEVASLVIRTAEKVIRKELNEQKNKELVLQYMDELK
jgi:F-type H+-transporting ATPase subunit b